MSAGDEVLVSGVEALDVREVGDGVELAVRASVALSTGQDKVPDAIQVVQDASALKCVGDDVVDVGEVGVVPPDADVPVAVEAGTSLVPVERTPAASDLGAPVSRKQVVAALIDADKGGVQA